MLSSKVVPCLGLPAKCESIKKCTHAGCDKKRWSRHYLVKFCALHRAMHMARVVLRPVKKNVDAPAVLFKSIALTSPSSDACDNVADCGSILACCNNSVGTQTVFEADFSHDSEVAMLVYALATHGVSQQSIALMDGINAASTDVLTQVATNELVHELMQTWNLFNRNAHTFPHTVERISRMLSLRATLAMTRLATVMLPPTVLQQQQQQLPAINAVGVASVQGCGAPLQLTARVEEVHEQQ